MLDWYTLIVIILLLILPVLIYIIGSDKSFEFWTGGPVRRFIF